MTDCGWGFVGWGDGGGKGRWMWERGYGVDEVAELALVVREEGVHRGHPRLFDAESGHVGEALEGFGDEGEGALGADAGVV